MKTHTILSVLLLLVMIVSCKKGTLYPIEGTWSITSYVNNGTDKTSQFAPFTFSFKNSGKLSISNVGMMNMCSFSIKDNVYHFNMMGMHNEPLSELDDNWMLMNLTDSTCSFIDDNLNRNCSFMMHRR